MRTLFNITPNRIEKPTKPFLYSFFNGLKKVLINKDKDRICKTTLFKLMKYLIKEIGASRNQNLINNKGRVK